MREERTRERRGSGPPTPQPQLTPPPSVTDQVRQRVQGVGSRSFNRPASDRIFDPRGKYFSHRAYLIQQQKAEFQRKWNVPLIAARAVAILANSAYKRGRQQRRTLAQAIQAPLGAAPSERAPNKRRRLIGPSRREL